MAVKRPLSTDLSTLAAGVGIILSGRILSRGFQLVNQVALARYLGPEQFGLFIIGWTVLRVVRAIGPLGIQNGVIHFGARHWRSSWGRLKDVLVVSLRTAAATGLVVGVLFFVAAPWLAEHVFHAEKVTWVLRAFALSSPFVTVLSVQAAAVRLTEKMQYSVLGEDLTQTGVQLFGTILVLWMGWKLFAAVGVAVASFVIAALVSLALGSWVFRKSLGVERKLTVGTNELLRYSVATALSGVLSGSILWVDRLFLGAMTDAGSLGVYQAASQVALVLIISLNGFGAVFSPMISRLYNAGEMARLQILFRTSTKWGLYLSLPILAVALTNPRGVIVALFGQAYAGGAVPLVILTLGQLVNLGTGCAGYLLIMTGHQDTWLRISGGAFAANLLLNWLLIPRFGLNGAAVATALAMVGLFGGALLQVKRRLKLWPYDRRYIKGLTAFTAAFILLLFWPNRPCLFGITAILTQLALSAMLIAGVLLALQLDDEDRELGRLIYLRIRKRIG